MMNLSKLQKKLVKTLLFTLLGCIVGYTYYRVIGCSTGSCSITSNPNLSTIYGGLMGFILALGFA